MKSGMRLRPARFVLLFAVILLAESGLLLAPFVQPGVSAFSRSLVSASQRVIAVCGGKARAEGTVLRAPATGFAIEMKDGCNGASVTMLLWAAVLAFPASWAQKLKGLVVGSVAIQAINFIRFISLFYLGQYNMSLFDFAHGYLWESLIMLDTLVVFGLWAQVVFRARDA